MMPSSDIFAAFRWWAVISLLGLAALPLTMYLLRRLPDKGYAFSKMVGLLIVTYLFWLLGSLGILGNNLGSIVLAGLILSALSALALRQYRLKSSENPTEFQPFSQWIHNHLGYILAAEIIFLLVFVFWVYARSQNPMISATEKPMEFGFLNSVGRSQTFPPLDPWLSGFAISYYYFGYVMTSVLTRLAFVPEFIGFNLAVPWLAAGAALGAFGLVFNLITAGREKLKRQAVIFGLIAAIAIPVAGNMEILLEVFYANDIGSADFWEYIDVRDLNTPPAENQNVRYETSSWWWWRSSRVINEHHLSGRIEEGLEPIAEFPAFSFILGDLHPHVLALPFAFLSLAVAFSWYMGSPLSLFWKTDTSNDKSGDGMGNRPTWQERAKETLERPSAEEWIHLGFTALVLGGLSFLNTWDVLIHLFVIIGAFILGRWRETGRWDKKFWSQGFGLAVILAIPAILLYIPFYLGFRSQAGPPFLLPMTMRPTRLVHFLVIFGLPLSVLTIFLATSIVSSMRKKNHSKNPWRQAFLAVAGLVIGLFILMLLLGIIIASNPEGAQRTMNLATELNVILPPVPDSFSLFKGMFWGIGAIAKLVPSFLAARFQYPALTLFLSSILIAIIVLIARQLQQTADSETSELEPGHPLPISLPFVLLLIGTAALLTLGPEFVYLKDVFNQRINTIFKFYYQAWILFGITAVVALSYLWTRFRISAIVASIIYGSALAAALLFPYFAVQSRSIEYRGPVANEGRPSATLNGLAFLERFNADEYESIMWLRENIIGEAVILEAVGGSYTGYARVSADTGIPTVLGWPGHERQWRGATPEPAIREPAISTIYSLSPWDQTANLLDEYNVTHIYFGRLEKETYDPQAEEKFDQNLEVAFQNDTVKIYRWQPE